MAKFALIGAAGYVAPKHMQAIKDVGGELVAALDPHDSVGILDSYSDNCLYFREPERFDRWLSKNPVDYVSVCSPNFLHDSHCLMAMRNGADVICEKPLVCNERNLDNLADWEFKTGKQVNAILQCRLHPEAIKAKEQIRLNKFYRVDVDYRTPRGPWYTYSWKSDMSKSGGLPTNIGIHLFDLAQWFFPRPVIWRSVVQDNIAKGFINFANAEMSWTLSIANGVRGRMFTIRSENEDSFGIDLTNGFADLHTESYKQILAGNGFGVEDARPAIRIVEAIRDASN